MATYWQKDGGPVKTARSNRQAVALKWAGYREVKVEEAPPAAEIVEAAKVTDGTIDSGEPRPDVIHEHNGDDEDDLDETSHVYEPGLTINDQDEDR